MLLLAIVALVVLLTLSVASLQIAMQSLNRAANKRDVTAARDLAEGAADRAEAWLRAQSTPPGGTSTIYPLGAGSFVMPTGAYTVHLVPDAGNPTAWRKRYTIVGSGTDKFGHTTRTVKIQVQQQSFALYAYFTDQEASLIGGGTVWFIGSDHIYGPAHTNDQFHINWNGGSSSNAIFHSTVSTHSSSAVWDPSKPSTTTDWRKVLTGGKDAMTFSADSIVLPTVSTLQKEKAWGGTSGFPSTAGVYVPNSGGQTTGGIYIVGDSAGGTVTFSPNSTVGQTVSIQNSTQLKKTEVLTNLSGNSTTVKTYTRSSTSNPWTLGTTNSYTGLTNGVIYDTQSITSLSGTLVDNVQDGSAILKRNAWTICTDVSAGKDITITGDLQYATHPDETQPITALVNLKAACLGLVADTVAVNKSTSNCRIDGVILAATGGFYNVNYATGSPSGVLSVSGGIIQKRRGPVGQFSGSSIIHGYSKDYHYDPRMADNPPPFFPTTGQFDIVAWQSN